MVLEQTRTYTLDEFRAIEDLPENQGKLLELIEGGIIEKVASFTPSKIGSRINRFVGNFVDEQNLGYVTGADGSYVMSDKNSFMPDVAYISRERLPEEPHREAHVPPDFAVEVKSPTDSKREMRKKAEKYLAFGTKLVWLVFPDEQEVEVYDGDKDVQNFGMDAVLNGGDVLPGFRLAVSDIFK